MVHNETMGKVIIAIVIIAVIAAVVWFVLSRRRG
jgi:preprotein translocase subunit YajC